MSVNVKGVETSAESSKNMNDCDALGDSCTADTDGASVDSYTYSENDYDDDTFNDNAGYTGSHNEFKYIDTDGKLYAYMDSMVSDCNELTGASSALIIACLRKYRWNIEKAKRAFTLSDSKEDRDLSFDSIQADMVNEFKVANIEAVLSIKYALDDSISIKSTTCCICWSNDISNTCPFISLGCQHYYCITCYSHFWNDSIVGDDNRQSNPFSLRCMHVDASNQARSCNIYANSTVVRKVFALEAAVNRITDTASTVSSCVAVNSSNTHDAATIDNDNKRINTYNKWLRQNFIEESVYLQECNKDGCHIVINHTNHEIANKQRYMPTLCSCGNSFCFMCHSSTDHRPCYCTAFAEWNERSTQFSGSILPSHIQKCPSCYVAIDRFEGCNHIRCKCGHEFCWICLQSCPSHRHPAGGCSQPEKNLTLEEKYQHYYKRYHAHYTSEKLESASLASKITNLNTVKDAMKTLLFSRNALQCGYIHNFWMIQNSTRLELELYEQQLQDLENHTERLSRILESFKGVDTNVYVKGIDKHIPEYYTNNVTDITKTTKKINKIIDLNDTSSVEGGVVLETLKNQTIASNMFLNNLLDTAKDNLADDNDVSTHNFIKANDEVGVNIFTSWFCSYCNESKKACTCIVSTFATERKDIKRDTIEKLAHEVKGDTSKLKLRIRLINEVVSTDGVDRNHDWFRKV